MVPLKIVAGQRFNSWTIKKEVKPKRKNQRLWLCECDCGTVKPVLQGNLVSGYSKTCGNCFQQIGHPLFNIWHGIKKRCYGKNANGYSRYGGRGIKLHQPWHDFKTFTTDIEQEIGKRPSLKHSIDRIDNNSHYKPKNIKWSTRLEQAHNQRNNINITYKSKTMCLSEWARELNINFTTLQNRVAKGWEYTKALSTPVRKMRV